VFSTSVLAYPPYKYTENWFGPEKYQRWIKLFPKHSVKNYLEIGVYEGRSFFWVLENISAKDGKAVAIDNFTGKVKDTFLRNVSLSGKSKKISLMNERSSEALTKLPKNSFDLIYIDGAHDMKTVLLDFELAWPLLKKGGYLVMDDDRETHVGMPDDIRPEKAIDTVIFAFRSEIEVLNRGIQAIVQKKEDKLHGCSTCSVFGHYSFEWYDYVLSDDHGRHITLLPQEQKQLEKILTSHKFPELEINSKNPVFAELKSKALLKKLHLKPNDFVLNITRIDSPDR
jgi:hypothetical protein